jgi:D-galacturonate reductase
MGHTNEITIDQAHRGYIETTDDKGMASLNPLYMKYSTDADGRFNGQQGYGYRSLEAFIDAVNAIKRGRQPKDFERHLATMNGTLLVTGEK